uniref:CSON011745 protein n=1 Tax=Culicoides sonorensis TaxID=179676 RepID=A0A336KKY3_CULSO
MHQLIPKISMMTQSRSVLINKILTNEFQILRKSFCRVTSDCNEKEIKTETDTCTRTTGLSTSVCLVNQTYGRSEFKIINNNRRNFNETNSVEFRPFSAQIRSFHNTSSKMASTQYENDQPNVISVEEARRFMIDCFVKANVPEKHAIAQADLLIAADVRGHFSHGMNRLEMYINDLLINSTAGAAVPEILKETPATAWVDGKNGLGAVVGEFCMDLAIKKAKTVGVGWVVAKRSNHYGIAGYYSLRAEKQGLIGMSMTNTSPLMSPTRSKGAALGTNPISVAAPANDGDSFVLDMATTAVAVGKIEIQRRKQLPIPEGWAQDPEGHPTTDAELGFKTGCLMPLGGSELTSGYKGYGLGALVEVLCGISAGSNFGPHIRKWTHAGADSEANLGQVFVAVDPNCFAPGFTDRMTTLNKDLRGMEPVDPNKPVLVAGDPERAHERKVQEEGGLRYHPNQIKTNHALAEKLKIKPIRFLNEIPRFKLNTNHSLIPPFDDSIKQHWHLTSPKIFQNCRISLTPYTNRILSFMWNENPTPKASWKAVLQYTAFNDEEKIADGIAFFLIPPKTSVSFGANMNGLFTGFMGLMIAIDNSKNPYYTLHQSNNQAAVNVVYNKIPDRYNWYSEGYENRLGSCVVNIRYGNSNQSISTLAVEYVDGVLNVYHTNKTQNLETNEMEFCTSVKGLEIPPGFVRFYAFYYPYMEAYEVHSFKFYDDKEYLEHEADTKKMLLTFILIIIVLLVCYVATIYFFWRHICQRKTIKGNATSDALQQQDPGTSIELKEKLDKTNVQFSDLYEEPLSDCYETIPNTENEYEYDHLDWEKSQKN